MEDVDEATMLERAVRDNQAYGEYELDELGTLMREYEGDGGDAGLLGLDEDEQAALRGLDEDDDTPAPDETRSRRRAETFAVTVSFESREDRDAFAAELRDAGHEGVRAHAGRMSEDE